MQPSEERPRTDNLAPGQYPVSILDQLRGSPPATAPPPLPPPQRSLPEAVDPAGVTWGSRGIPTSMAPAPMAAPAQPEQPSVLTTWASRGIPTDAPPAPMAPVVPPAPLAAAASPVTPPPSAAPATGYAPGQPTESVVGGRWPTPAPAAAAPPTAAAAASAFDKREAWRRETTPEGVHVCRGTWCTYDGSREVLSRFRQAIKAMGMQDRVRVRGVPCMAFCQTGPFVKVLPDKTRYWDVTPEAVDWIISQHFDPSQPPRTDIVPDPPGVETGPIERAPYGVRKGTIPAVIQSAMMRLARLRG